MWLLCNFCVVAMYITAPVLLPDSSSQKGSLHRSTYRRCVGVRYSTSQSNHWTVVAWPNTYLTSKLCAWSSQHPSLVQSLVSPHHGQYFAWNYCIVPNFQGTKFSWIGLLRNFLEIIFVDWGMVSHAHSDATSNFGTLRCTDASWEGCSNPVCGCFHPLLFRARPLQ